MQRLPAVRLGLQRKSAITDVLNRSQRYSHSMNSGLLRDPTVVARQMHLLDILKRMLSKLQACMWCAPGAMQAAVTASSAVALAAAAAAADEAAKGLPPSAITEKYVAAAVPVRDVAAAVAATLQSAACHTSPCQAASSVCRKGMAMQLAPAASGICCSGG